MVITSACHAEGPSSILGNSVKDVYCMFLQNILGVTGSIPVSPNSGDCSSIGRARGVVMFERTHILFWQLDTYSNFNSSLEVKALDL